MSLIKVLGNVNSAITILAAYLCHIYKYKIVGFLVDYDVNFSSTLFVFSLASLFAEYKLWPVTLRRPPCALLLLYETLLVTLLTNVARTLVWMPAVITLKQYLPVVAKKIVHLNSRLKLRKYGILYKFSKWLDSSSGLNEFSNLLAIGIFMWVLYSTDSFDHIRELVKKIRHKLRRKACVTFCTPQTRRPGGTCGPPSGRTPEGINTGLREPTDGQTVSQVDVSGDIISVRRESLDSDIEEETPPPTLAVPSGS